LGRATGDLPSRIPPEACSEAASSAVATPRVARGPAHAGSRRIAPAHRGAFEAANVGMASKLLCLETGRLKAASTPRKAWLQWGNFFEAPLGKNGNLKYGRMLWLGEFRVAPPPLEARGRSPSTLWWAISRGPLPLTRPLTMGGNQPRNIEMAISRGTTRCRSRCRPSDRCRCRRICCCRGRAVPR